MRSQKSGYLPLYSDLSCTQQGKNPQKIPKIFHQIWHDWGKGHPNPSALYQGWTEARLKLHPGWVEKLWRIEDSRAFIAEFYPWFLPTYDGYDKPIKRVDALRYFILDHFGGVYVDMDSEALKNMEPYIEGCNLVVGHEDSTNYVINNAFMASVPGYSLWNKIQHALVARKDLGVLKATGPIMLTELIHEYLSEEQPLFFKVYEQKYIYPIHWSVGGGKSEAAVRCVQSVELCRELYPEAFHVDFFGASWVEK